MSRGRSRERIKGLAFLLRKELGFENVHQLDMPAVLAAFKRLYPSFDYVRVGNIRIGHHELPEAEGMYNPETRVLEIPSRVFEGLENGQRRARFSIAHELAHPILQHASIRFRRAERKVYERAKGDIRREEREADQFAAFFLAPDHLIEGCSTVEDLMDRFGLSRPAAEIRKEEYERDLRHKRGEERPLTSNVIDFLREQEKTGHKVTALRTAPERLRTVAASKSASASNSYQQLKTKPETDICSRCGNLALERAGLEWRCSFCGLVLPV